MYALVIVATLYLLLIGGFVLVFRAQRQHPKTASKIPLYSLRTSAVLAVVVLVLGFYFIFSSRSSTAGIGFLFVPIYALGAAIAGSTISWSFLTLAALASRARARLFADKPTPIVASTAAVVLLTGFVAAYMVGTRPWLLAAAESPETQVQRLHEIADVATAENDLGILQRLAKNSAVPDGSLREVYKHCADARETRAKNLCYSVFHSLAWNKSTPTDLLHELAKNPKRTIRRGVALNQGTPLEVLEQLIHDDDSSVRESLAGNPNLPLRVLTELTRDDDERVRSWAERIMKRRTNK